MIYFSNYWFPFDAYRLEAFPFAQIWVHWITYLLVSLLLASDLLLYLIIIIISMEFDFLRNNLKSLKSESKDEGKFKIKSFVERHNKLFELSDKLQRIFEPFFLYNFITSSVIMCIISFHFLFCATEPVVYTFDVFYFVNISGQIWLLCYFGQKLIDSSNAIADGMYESDWTNLDDNEVKSEVELKDRSYSAQWVLLIFRSKHLQM